MPVLTPERLERHTALVAELRCLAASIAQAQAKLTGLIAAHNAAIDRAYALQGEVLGDIEELTSAGLGTPALERLQVGWEAMRLRFIASLDEPLPLPSAADAIATLPLDG